MRLKRFASKIRRSVTGQFEKKLRKTFDAGNSKTSKIFKNFEIGPFLPILRAKNGPKRPKTSQNRFIFKFRSIIDRFQKFKNESIELKKSHIFVF